MSASKIARLLMAKRFTGVYMEILLETADIPCASGLLHACLNATEEAIADAIETYFSELEQEDDTR